MVYNNELYTLPESIDINAFCGEGNWTIPLKNTDPLVIPADKHSCLSELFFTTNNDSTTIDDYFLYGSGIKALDLSWLDSIEIIGDSFLHNCYFLTELTLPENNIISKVGTDFLHNCSNLVADIKLTHLTQTAIPKNFITNCPKLNSINLSGSNQINTIDEGFLTGFSGSLDLSGWTQMTTVTRQMFPDKIKSLNLSGWTSVTTISKENFPADLSSLTLSGWTQMTTITRQMFPDNLKVLDLSGWTSMTTLSEDWWPTSVETLNLAGWTGITNLTEDMLGNTIANYNLSGWTGLKTIGDNVLKENSKVYSLNLSGAVNLETIGDDFCFVPQEGVIEWRGPLEYVNLSGFKNIKEIGENFIAGTLFHYGGFYYYDVNLIKSIDLSSWTTTNSVDEDFLQICYYLVTADFSGFTSVSTFGNDLCEWWAEMVWIKLPVFNKGDFAEQMLDRFADNTDFTVTKKGMFVAPKGEGEKWDNYFKHKATNNIVEQGTGYLTYNNENFILADNIDPNVFCKEGSWTVPTKNAGVIVIPESKRNAIRTFALPETITQTEIGNNFLSGCSELAHLDLSALKNVTKIGDNFLQGCSSLSSLDLNGLSNVVSVGNNFLSGLTFISLLDLSPMLKIESIGNNFLSGSSSIIDLTVFNKDPTNITIDSKNFLNTVNKYCFTIHAGLYLNKYKATEPWTEFANNIVE